MNEQELNEIERREQAATPGPWLVVGADKAGENWLVGYGTDSITGKYIYITTDHLHASEHNGATAKDDADFCAHARTGVPKLIAEVRRLTKEKAQLRVDAALLRRGFSPTASAEIERLEQENASLRERLEFYEKQLMQYKDELEKANKQLEALNGGE